MTDASNLTATKIVQLKRDIEKNLGPAQSIQALVCSTKLKQQIDESIPGPRIQDSTAMPILGLNRLEGIRIFDIEDMPEGSALSFTSEEEAIFFMKRYEELKKFSRIIAKQFIETAVTIASKGSINGV